MDVQEALRGIWHGDKRHAVLIFPAGTDMSEAAENLAYNKKKEEAVPFPVDLSHAHGEHYIVSEILRTYCAAEETGDLSARGQLLEYFNAPSSETPAFRLILHGLDTAPRNAAPALCAELSELSACRGVQIVLMTAYDFSFLETSFGFDGIEQFSSIRLAAPHGDASALLPQAAEGSGRALHNTLLDVNDQLAKADETSKRLKKTLKEVNRAARTPQQKRRKTGRIALICAAALALLLGGILFVRKQNAPPAEAPAEPEMIDLVLTPETSMTLAEFAEATETIRARLDVFTAGETYTFSVEDNSIHVQLPAETLGGVSMEDAMYCYIARPTALYFMTRIHASNFGTIPVSRSDLASVRLVYGSIDGVDPLTYDYEGDTYPYIEIVLSDDFVAQHAEELASWENPIFAQDISAENNVIYYSETFPDPDGKTFRLLEESFLDNYVKTTLYDYTHDPLPGSFFISSYSTAVSWEDPAASLRAGEHQVKEEEITKPFVTITYSSYTEDMVSGDWLDAMLTLKARLDAVGQPYAIGTQEVGGYAGVLIKTGSSWIAPYMPAFAHLLVKSRYDTEFLVHGTESYDRACGTSYFLSPHVTAKENGAFALRVSVNNLFDSDPVLSLADYAESVCTPEEPGLFLRIGNLPLLAATKDDIVDDKTVEFHHVYGRAQENINEEERWIFDFVKVLLEASFPITLTPEGVSYSSEDAAEQVYTSSPYYADRTAISNAICAAVPTASVSFPKPGEVQICLDIYIDGDLPATALEQIKAVYNASGFEDSRFTQLFFVLVAEDDSAFERARVSFRKPDYFQESDGIYWHYIFANGRLEKYKAEFEEALSNSDFFSGGEFLTF